MSRDLSSPPGYSVDHHLILVIYVLKQPLDLHGPYFDWCLSSSMQPLAVNCQSWAASNGPAIHLFFTGNKCALMKHNTEVMSASSIDALFNEKYKILESRHWRNPGSRKSLRCAGTADARLACFACMHALCT